MRWMASAERIKKLHQQEISMRPRKKILLWGENADQAGALAFVLTTAALADVDRFDAEARLCRALMTSDDGVYSLLILHDSGNHDATETLAYIAHQMLPRLPVLVLCEANEAGLPEITYANSVVMLNLSREYLLGQIKVMLARKRGPRPAAPISAVKGAA
jgi:hypothetical protein